MQSHLFLRMLWCARFMPFFQEACIPTHVFSVLSITALWFLLQSSASLGLWGYDVPTYLAGAVRLFYALVHRLS